MHFLTLQLDHHRHRHYHRHDDHYLPGRRSRMGTRTYPEGAIQLWFNFFSLNILGLFLPQQVYHHSDAERPISSETIFFHSLSNHDQCGLVFIAQPLKMTNYIFPSHCPCRPKIFHSAAQTNCHVNFSKKGNCDENLDKLLTALSGQSWGHVTKPSARRRSERIISFSSKNQCDEGFAHMQTSDRTNCWYWVSSGMFTTYIQFPGEGNVLFFSRKI